MPSTPAEWTRMSRQDATWGYPSLEEKVACVERELG
jgi:hypothetical protein